MSAAATVVTKARHLYEVDVLRILTFACVIGVHTTSHTARSEDVGLYGLLALLHFTREVFFWLTSFVLALSYLAKPTPLKKFWPKRFLLVGIPYLTWTAIYFLASNIQRDDLEWNDIGGFLYRVVTGTGWYHLYFLLVTMQVYLLHPLIMWLVRKTAGRHALLLSVAAVFQLAITAVYMYLPGSLGFVSSNSKIFFFSYLFFILAGAVCAWHKDAFLGWVRGNRRLIAVITAVGALVLLTWWWIAHLQGLSLYRAGTPLQPIMMVWSAAIGLGFLALGTWWADRRDPASFTARAVDQASDRSFAIFLIHPLLIWVLGWAGAGWLASVVPSPWLTLLVYVTVIAGSIVFAEIARRTPASLPLTGRRYQRRRVGG
ncbi:acyltransferase [Schumannella sp. 10F1B-5-1]|uniref:acyltransferase n=1 Tax=Schumannella sp. 10F1B-5-1 TaxID=2590780 RepID=UPI0011319EFA|nr:acyltransferase [Schumannella sp. 10F1B-5-1]TPW70995.1 acyltransferase [Schumannella sp. 10F1B-5-1]